MLKSQIESTFKKVALLFKGKYILGLELLQTSISQVSSYIRSEIWPWRLCLSSCILLWLFYAIKSNYQQFQSFPTFIFLFLFLNPLGYKTELSFIHCTSSYLVLHLSFLTFKLTVSLLLKFQFSWPTRATTRMPRKTLSALQRMCITTMESSVTAKLNSLCLLSFWRPLRICNEDKKFFNIFRF